MMRYRLPHSGHFLPTGAFLGGIFYRNTWGWGETHHALVKDRETNFYYHSKELDREITTFFDSIQTQKPVAPSPFINFCRAVDHLEDIEVSGSLKRKKEDEEVSRSGDGDGPEVSPANDAPRPSEAPQAMDYLSGSPSEAPQAMDYLASSPLDQFSIHPIIPLALGLGLFLLLVFFSFGKYGKTGKRVDRVTKEVVQISSEFLKEKITKRREQHNR